VDTVCAFYLHCKFLPCNKFIYIYRLTTLFVLACQTLLHATNNCNASTDTLGLVHVRSKMIQHCSEEEDTGTGRDAEVTLVQKKDANRAEKDIGRKKKEVDKDYIPPR